MIDEIYSSLRFEARQAKSATSYAQVCHRSRASSCLARQSSLSQSPHSPDWSTGSLFLADLLYSRITPTRAVRLQVLFREGHSRGCTYKQTSLAAYNFAVLTTNLPVNNLIPLIAHAIVGANFMRPIIVHPVSMECNFLPIFRGTSF